MKISTRGRYGLRAMIDLAAQPGDTFTTLKSIAGRQGISENYLEQLMAALKKAGYVKSGRGACGGYRLNRRPGTISVGDILRVLEGSLFPVHCVGGENVVCSLANKECCVTKSVWERIYSSLTDVVDSITLLELAEDYKKANGIYRKVI